jgi:hypothetical protein
MKLLQGLQSIRRRYRLQHVVANWRLPRLRSSGADKWACMISLPDAMIPWMIARRSARILISLSQKFRSPPKLLKFAKFGQNFTEFF